MVRLATLALAALTVLINPTFGAGVNWVFSEGNAIAISRMDPVVNSGEVAGHVHNVVGGSKFSQNAATSAELLQSQCSSVNVQADKSNYWAPQLYYRYADNTLAPMLGSARIYYFNTNHDVVPFPPGMKMLAGLAMSRNASDPRSAGIRWSCNHGAQTNKMPNRKDNPGGCNVLVAGMFFPSCGLADGSTDSEDHFSHMAYAISFSGVTPFTDPGGGAYCPTSHPIHYPAIFLEYNYFFNGDQPWRDEDNLLVLSNGDTTGLAYHSDFQNGWDQAVLKEAIDTCYVGDDVASCPPFKKSVTWDGAQNCRLEGKIPSEDVGLYKSLKKLPGCNPLWTASMPDTKPTCDVEPATPGFSGANAYFRSDWLRMNVPLTLPEATPNKLTDWYRPNNFQEMTPMPGGTSSIIKVWGTEALAKYVTTATVPEIMKTFVFNNGTKAEGGAVVASPIAVSSSSSISASSSSSTTSTSTTTSSSSATAVPTSQLLASAVSSSSSSSSSSISSSGTSRPTPTPVPIIVPSPSSSTAPSSTGTSRPTPVPMNDPASSSSTSSSSNLTTSSSSVAAAIIPDPTCLRRTEGRRRIVVRKSTDLTDSIRSHLARRRQQQRVSHI